jgi:hypothetical protein
MNNKTDNEFLYLVQEGKLKSIKEIIIDGNYIPNKKIYHEAIYLSFLNNKLNTFRYILSLDINIDILFNNGFLLQILLMFDDFCKLFFSKVKIKNNEINEIELFIIKSILGMKSENMIKHLKINLINTNILKDLSHYLQTILNSNDDLSITKNKIINMQKIITISNSF